MVAKGNLARPSHVSQKHRVKGAVSGIEVDRHTGNYYAFGGSAYYEIYPQSNSETQEYFGS